MNSQDMRSLFGDGVCITLKNTTRGGPFDLTPAAKYYAEFLLETVDSVGHCAGFAVAAAALYNGFLKPSDLGALTLANQSQLTVDTQSELLRQWATQLFTPVSKTTPADVVRTRVYLTSAGDFDAVARAHGAVFSEIRPANSTVVVAALLNPEWKVEIEADAILAD
jgi:enamine deaminase RidA (YjgF/YER057c/UK114 family)